MPLSRKTKIICVIVLLIIIFSLSLFLVIYFSIKNLPSQPTISPHPPAPEPPIPLTKQNIGDPMAISPPNAFGSINSQNNGTAPDITSNTINNINLDLILRLCNLWFGNNINDKTWADVNGVCCIQLQLVQNTINYTYSYDITQIDVKNNIITFDAPTNFYLPSQQVWPIYISLNYGGKVLKVINY